MDRADKLSQSQQLRMDTSVVKGLTPSASIFGVDLVDAFFLLGLFFPSYILAGFICPPLRFNADPVAWLGGPHNPNAAVVDLSPMLPGIGLWLVLSLIYLAIRANKPRGYLPDLFEEIIRGFQVFLSDPDQNSWDAGGPDLKADRYVLPDESITTTEGVTNDGK
jgi:hypothetical protein